MRAYLCRILSAPSLPSAKWGPRAALGAILCLSTAGMAVAQPATEPSTAPALAAQPTPAPPSRRNPGRWMFEIHGGRFGDPRNEDAGPDGDAFPVGTAFTTASGGPSRAVSAWTYGDGAALFNEIRRSFAAGQGVDLPAITPLDGIMRIRGVSRTASDTLGARLSGNLTSWLGVEVSVDRGPGRSALSQDVIDGLEASRASYTRAFEALLAQIPQNDGRVTATVTTSAAGSGTRTVATGSLVLSPVRVGRLGLHLMAGGGYVINDSPDFEVRLQAGYRFSVLSRFPITESETVSIRYAEKRRAPAVIAGVGMTLRLAGRSGLRVDARVIASEHPSTTTVQSSPSSQVAQQSIVFPSLTTPSLQFSTAAGVRSTLSGEMVSGLVTHRGGGRQVVPHFTVGYYIRF